MLRKFFPLLTDSEFHCFLVGAHSTIAGFAFGLFVLFGVKAQHLLTGAVMSAPAAVAIAKLNYPETQESKLKNDEDFNLGNGYCPSSSRCGVFTLAFFSLLPPSCFVFNRGAHNVFEAAADGTLEAAKGGFEILVQVRDTVHVPRLVRHQRYNHTFAISADS